MLGKYLKINGVTLPNPVKYSDNMPPNENKFFTESGIMKIVPIRLDRMTWSGTFQVTSAMKAQLEGYCKLARVTCQVNNMEYQGTLRRDGSAELYEGSEYISGTDGLYTMGLIFEQF